MKRSVTLGLMALMLVPALAGAQERERSRDRVEVRPGAPMEYRMFSSNRARLGITVAIRANEDSDKIGARIQSVLADSPAEKAGLKEGDIITRFNNISLAGSRAGGDDQSGPGQRLVELAQRLEKGDTVKIEYRRDGQTRTTTVIADEVGPDVSLWRTSPDMEQPFRFQGPEGRAFTFQVPEGGGFNMEPGFSFFTGRSGVMGLDMVEMNSDLGEYFGTTDGLLVTATPEDSTVPLRAGDVLLSIDGRKPTSISHARRILGSYENGETVKLEIMRKHQRQTVDWKVDTERRELRMKRMLPTREERSQRM